MDRPELTKRQQKIMVLIGQKKPEECDTIEKHVRKKAAELSFQIEQTSGQLSSLREQVSQMEKDLQIYIGKFLATAELAEEHSMSKAKIAMENAPKCSGCGVPFPGDPSIAQDGELLCGPCSEKKNAEDSADTGQPNPPAEEEHPPSSADKPEEGASA